MINDVKIIFIKENKSGPTYFGRISKKGIELYDQITNNYSLRSFSSDIFTF